MATPVRNPAALRLLIGWLALAALTIGGFAMAGFTPSHPGFNQIVAPAAIALLLQGGAALMAAKRGLERMGWIILLAPPAVFLLTVVLFLVLFAAGIS